MTGGFRSTAKRLAPVGLKKLAKIVRSAVAPPPIDEVVLADYRFEADPCCKLRINLVIPNLAASSAFGGVITGIDVFLHTAVAISSAADIEIRVILTESDRETDLTLLTKRSEKMGIAHERITFVKMNGRRDALSICEKDVFFTYNWWTTLNIQKLRREQSIYFGRRILPLVYLIQEYEPQLFAFSSAHLLAREAYDGTERLWGVFNSSNLYNYFVASGHRVEKSFVFEPVISDSLRPALLSVANSFREKRILVYGRPGIDRNCFPALVRGLRTWVRDYPEFADWEIVSAGTAHKRIPLGGGRSLTSVGKLSLHDYSNMLLSSSVGISLMASPHPSYPPLEMAHMGLRTITNTYQCKDLADFHPNIISIPSIGEDILAKAIAEACGRFGGAISCDSNPNYIRGDYYPFIRELSSDILREAAAC